MKTWLLTWNKEKFAWDDERDGYKQMITEINQMGCSYCRWSCGNNRSIQEGDRVFLIKLGNYPKGIVGSGYAASNPFDDEDQATRRIFVRFDKIYNYEMDKILGYNELLNISEKFNWMSQSSGVSIPVSIANKLEDRWRDLDSENFLNSFGLEFVQETNEFTGNGLDISELLAEYDFQFIKQTKKVREYKSSTTHETIYTVLSDELNVVVHPDTFLNGYNGMIYHNSDLTKFPKRLNAGMKEIYYGMKYDFEHEFELELFISALTQKLSKIDYEGKTTWLMSISPKVYDHVSSFKANKFIDTKQFNNYELGDIVLLYSSSPVKRIIAGAQVTKINLTSEEIINDREFWYKDSDYKKNLEYNRFVRLELIHFINDDKLTFEYLKENGLKNAPQSAMKLNEQLFDYIYNKVLTE